MPIPQRPAVLTGLTALLLTPPVPAALAQSAPQGATPAQQESLRKDSAQKEPTQKERELLEKIRQLKAPRWRQFGVCRYDWGGWRVMAATATRTTSAECGNPPVADTVAVHCGTLKINRRRGDGPWGSWRLPYSEQESATSGGEDRMVAHLCANAQPLPEPQPANAAPAPQADGPTKAAPPASKAGTPPKPAAPAKPVGPAKAN